MTAFAPLTRAPRLDPRMRSLFREIARDLIAKDRDARKHGLSQNTIGEIERALVKAYIFGYNSRVDSPTTHENFSKAIVDWTIIPPRSRETLISMSYSFSARLGTPNYKPHDIERFTENGRIRWAFVYQNTRSQHSFADGSVAPLVRLGLIAAIDAAGTLYSLTALGVRTCQDYWRRSDADDSTLPRENMR